MRAWAALLVACAAAAAGCSGDDEGGSSAPPPAADSPSGARATAAPPRTTPLKQAHCPARLTNCKTARGRIIYVERVDPDGDGDAHFVLVSRQAITLPGLSVIDVEKSLRPHPLPVNGDRVSAAGPVYRGSYGQRQIQAIELHVARARR